MFPPVVRRDAACCVSTMLRSYNIADIAIEACALICLLGGLQHDEIYIVCVRSKTLRVSVIP
jgi:hypothetical protein